MSPTRPGQARPASHRAGANAATHLHTSSQTLRSGDASQRSSCPHHHHPRAQAVAQRSGCRQTGDVCPAQRLWGLAPKLPGRHVADPRTGRSAPGGAVEGRPGMSVVSRAQPAHLECRFGGLHACSPCWRACKAGVQQVPRRGLAPRAHEARFVFGSSIGFFLL